MIIKLLVEGGEMAPGPALSQKAWTNWYEYKSSYSKK